MINKCLGSVLFNTTILQIFHTFDRRLRVKLSDINQNVAYTVCVIYPNLQREITDKRI